MAKCIANLSVACHKFLATAILLSLLIANHSPTTLAQISGSASVNANVRDSGSSSGGGGLVGAATGAITGGLAGAQAGAKAGANAGNNGVGGVSGSLSMSGGSGGSQSGGGRSMSASGSASTDSRSGSSQVGASVSINSTPKPEGLLSKMKDIVKSSVDSLTSSKDEKINSIQASGNASSGGSSTLGSSSGSASASGSMSANSGSMSAKASAQIKSGSQKEGIIDKLADVAKRGKETIKETAKEVKDDVKSLLKPEGSESSMKASDNVKIGGSQANANVQVGSEGLKKDGPISKMVHKIEDKASVIGEKLVKPFGSSESSSSSMKAQANVKVGPLQANGKVSIGSGSSQSDSKSLTVDVLDKAHDVIKKPLEQILKPLDQSLGVKQDPMIKMFDNSHDLLMQPVGMLSKPVESALNNAFKTSDEARRESEQLMSEQERRAAKRREERAKKDNRSILGQIIDKNVELAETPLEIILKPVDRVLGLEKKGQKNPLIQLIDEIYGFSKKPLDTVVKPFEDILRKMAEGDQAYQVSVRYNGDAADPKIFTRLADGALNIADRIITKPIDLAMRPLGYSNRNPIVEATHQLKNATRVGVELFTKPIDRIIKEIADIGAIKNEAEREAEMERKRQEASRIVRALDKLNEAAQAPWEIVLRPVGRVLGYSKDGQREPLLRAWDVIHQVVRTPIQVLSKPIEDAFLGEPNRQSKFNAKAELRVGGKSVKVDARAGASGGSGSARAGVSQADDRKNVFVESIKKVEKFAAKPLDFITSPIRRLILGEDSRKITASANVKAGGAGGGQAQVSAQAGAGGNQPDKIVQTIKQMNNVVLKPFEVITQPISDIISSDPQRKPMQQSPQRNLQSQKKIDVKVQGNMSQQKGSVHASAQAQSKA